MQEKKILIVDADGATTEALSTTCRNFGFRVGVLPQAQGLLEMLHEGLPDLLILAVDLPDQNGFVLCKQIKSEKRLEKLPIVMIADREGAKAFDKHRKLKDAVEGYLTKPIDSDDFMDLVEDLIGLPAMPSARKDAVTPEAFRALQMQFDALQLELANIKSDRDRLQKQIDAKEREIAIVRESFESVSAKLDKAKHELGRRNDALQESEQRMIDLQADHAAELERVRSQMHEEEGQRERAFEALNVAMSDLQRQIDELITEKEEIQGRLEVAQRRNKLVDDENQQRESALKQRIKDLLATVDDEKQQREEFQRRMENMQAAHAEALDQQEQIFRQMEDEKIKMEQRVVKAYKKIKMDQLRDEKIEKAVEVILTLVRQSQGSKDGA